MDDAKAKQCLCINFSHYITNEERYFFFYLDTNCVWFFPVSHHVSKMGGYSRIKQELESKKQEFIYEEVLTITRNFEKVVGKGASGTVYHGWIDHDTEVAVKMLSSESVQGYMQFQAEVVSLINLKISSCLCVCAHVRVVCV
jgi:hypothetical protein